MEKRYNESQFSFGEVMRSNGISFPKISGPDGNTGKYFLLLLPKRCLQCQQNITFIHLPKEKRKPSSHSPITSLRPLFPSAHAIHLSKIRRNPSLLPHRHRCSCSQHGNREIKLPHYRHQNKRFEPRPTPLRCIFFTILYLHLKTPNQPRGLEDLKPLPEALRIISKNNCGRDIMS